ncbi:MAG TPA: hypothetical protein DDZ53_04945 [Firmicutes bacterium]|nr:hypothetical protein [Bacillota bacterium]
MHHDKRQKILAAAADIFATQGFHQTTIEQIADVAGVGKGTVYLYFKNKKGLFDALLLESSQRVLKRTKEVVQAHTNPLERMRMLTHMQLQILKQNHPLMQMIMREFSPDKLKDLRPELEQHMRELMALYTLVLEEGIAAGYLRQHNPQVIALAFLGAVNQIGANLNNGRLQVSLAECEEELYQFLIAGLQREGN